jgi:5-(carboxyamino)imidazole ribonucleotide synthase
MVDWIQPGKTVGIVGGGNIARLLTLAAKKLGYNVGILDPHEGCPAKGIADWYLKADFSNKEAFQDLAMKSDVVIYEMEAFDSEFVEMMQRTVPVPQGEDLLSASQDRMLQKAFLESISVNIAPYATIVSLEDVKEAVESIGYPCVLKSNQVDERFKQHYVLYGEEDIEGAQKFLNKGTCVMEAWIPKERELCIALAKDGEGNIATYPVTETIYRNDALYQAITPARVYPEMIEEIERVARLIGEQFNFVGVIAIEFFATSSGSLYVNEVVAHPHEAFNYTMDSEGMSQYEAHIRAVCGMNVSSIKELNNGAVMVPFHQEHIDTVYHHARIKPDWHFTFYQGAEDQVWDEIGHITIPTRQLEQTLTFLADIDIWSINN